MANKWTYTIKARAPVDKVYEYFTKDPETLSSFEHIRGVTKKDGKLQWRVKCGARIHEYSAEINASPHTIKWESEDGQHGCEIALAAAPSDQNTTIGTVTLTYPDPPVFSIVTGNSTQPGGEQAAQPGGVQAAPQPGGEQAVPQPRLNVDWHIWPPQP